jgi:predicted cupin superfamily sugar epimerase
MALNTVSTRPAGSIASTEQLLDLVAQAKEGGPVSVYYVHGLGRASSVAVYELNAQTTVENQRIVKAVSVYDSGRYDTEFSLLDCNVSGFNRYNDHFLFENRKLAEQYAQACRSNEEQERATQAHWARCRAFDHIIDRWMGW